MVKESEIFNIAHDRICSIKKLSNINIISVAIQKFSNNNNRCFVIYEDCRYSQVILESFDTEFNDNVGTLGDIYHRDLDLIESICIIINDNTRYGYLLHTTDNAYFYIDVDYAGITHVYNHNIKIEKNNTYENLIYIENL